GYMVTEDFTVFVTGADGTSVAVSAIPGTYLGYEFVMPAQDVTITATGIDTRTYAIYQDVVDGAATTAPESAKYLDTVTFDVVLEKGFVASEDFKVVVDGKELVGTGMTFTFEMPAHDVTIVVDGVVPATYTITAIDGEGYHITAPATAQYKSFVDFDVEIFNGYQSTSEYVVYVNGYPVAAIYGDVIEYFGYFFGENYFYGFEMPAEDVVITVEGVVPAPLVLIIIDSIDNDYIGGNYTTAHVFEVEVGHSFKTADSYREGKSFGGYYADESLTVPVDITAPMTVSIVSFVKWLDVFTVEINGDEVLVGEGDSLRSVLTPFQQEAFVFTEAGVAYDLDAPVTSNLVLDAEFISAGDEVYWYVTDDCKTLIVLGNGDMYDYTKTESAPWAVFNSTIQNVFILGDASEYDTVADLLFEFGLVTGAEYLVVADLLESYADAGFTGITTIGQFAFHAMKIKNLYIGDSVVTISKYAFNKVVAFTNVVFGAGVKNIGKWAFSVNFYMYNDDGTVSIDNVITAETRGPNTSSTQSIFMLSKGVNTAIVNNLAFTKCGSYALVATDVVGISGDAIWEIGVSPVEEEYFGVLSIYGGDMADSKNYASVPWYNYMQCFNKVVIYDGVAHVDKYAFYNYDNIDSFTFSGDLTNVGKYSFYGMTFQGEAAKDAKLAGHDYVKVAAGTYVLA
ncbi:MAG: leucine-rich repeat domain-containing protein, partial [archaeon]|nr:leucine-rich repeat domain-containing protein [archaeon]